MVWKWYENGSLFKKKGLKRGTILDFIWVPFWKFSISSTAYYSKVKVPVWRFLWLLTFVFQVSGIRTDKRSFFVSYQQPHKSVTSQTLARWMKVMLADAGVDPVVWKPHAVRAASSTHHTNVRQLDLGQVCRLADWSMASSTYLKFYKRYV